MFSQHLNSHNLSNIYPLCIFVVRLYANKHNFKILNISMFSSYKVGPKCSAGGLKSKLKMVPSLQLSSFEQNSDFLAFPLFHCPTIPQSGCKGVNYLDIIAFHWIFALRTGKEALISLVISYYLAHAQEK